MTLVRASLTLAWYTRDVRSSIRRDSCVPTGTLFTELTFVLRWAWAVRWEIFNPIKYTLLWLRLLSIFSKMDQYSVKQSMRSLPSHSGLPLKIYVMATIYFDPFFSKKGFVTRNIFVSVREFRSYYQNCVVHSFWEFFDIDLHVRLYTNYLPYACITKLKNAILTLFSIKLIHPPSTWIKSQCNIRQPAKLLSC